ncbi:mechanosensitive ion channel [Hymenobacter busanensis]|uniref:Mechanosensitive ion channel n=1 Tax=Hymenobacter busanensis TaxID=2607656 RepID=A0A7L4ZTB3_9BACT|nr:mechanosensitive ion channel domain-containing protein [Hymenobacter busanensis]KAA9327489.1 mechanosensitive ion channel [Hymenobacter busanensis]QHJ06173.1 mechanosensitive ion channel [Hymenobacter busanensis]
MLFNDLRDVLNTYWAHFLFLLPKLGVALVLLFIAIFISNRVSRLLGGRLQARSHDPLLAVFLTRFSKWALLLLGLLLVMQVLGMTGVVSGVLAGAGLTAFVVGFALKDIAENFLAGVVLAFNRPFRIHDTVQIKDKDLMGRVEALNLRTTLIKTFDGKDIYLPNAMVLREPLINFTRDGHIRQDFQVGIDIGEERDLTRVQQLILDFVRSFRDVETEEPHTAYLVVEKTDGSTATLHVYFWTFSEDYRRRTQELKSELMQGIRKLLLDQGYSKPATLS